MGWHFTTDIFREPTGMSTTTSHNDQSSAYFTSLDADGFTVGTPGTFGGLNGSGVTAVAWCWKANGSGSANTNGTINTTATSANVSAGFSIIDYIGNGTAGATIGHGLSVAPNLVIVKARTGGAADWQVGSIQPMASMDFTDKLRLNNSGAKTDSADNWNDTAPTLTVVSLGAFADNNTSGSRYVAYCWHSVEGYSKIGSYKGNGNVDGAFVYCGFRPRYILLKYIGGTENWRIFDSKRDPYNQATHHLMASHTGAETNETGLDILSNGFKLRHADAHQNANGGYYLYMAFAENSFKHTTAR